MSFNFTAMILAAGFGRRMMPLTKNLPKPLIDVNGITLLDNAINFLKNLGCNKIIINSHYFYPKIKLAISQNKNRDNITLIYEKEILDTGGGVKNAIPYFKSNNILILNSDVFWRNENLLDAKTLINSYINNQRSILLLVNKINAFGLLKLNGDFILDNNRIKRFKQGNEIIYYSGLQILNLNVFKNFSNKKIPFNSVWDFLIAKQNLFGIIMKSKWYHIGDRQGLSLARKLVS